MKTGKTNNWYKKAINFTKTASMTLHVQSFPYQEDLSQMGAICYKAQYLIIPYMKEFLSDNDYKEWKKDAPHEFITPDGDDYFKRIGTINLYMPNVPKESISQISQTTRQIFEKLGLVISNIKTDMSASYNIPVIRFMVSENENKKPVSPPEINISNTNAYKIFRDILKYEQDLWEDGSFDIAELKNRVIYFLGETKYDESKQEDVEEFALDIQKGLFGGNYLEGDEWKRPDAKGLGDMLSGREGISPYKSDDIRNRLQQILTFCNWALDRGFTEAYLA